MTGLCIPSSIPGMVKKRTAKAAPKALKFTRTNALLGVGGAVSLTLGYWMLSQGSITAAPLFLVLGYLVLIPMAIIK